MRGHGCGGRAIRRSALSRSRRTDDHARWSDVLLDGVDQSREGREEGTANMVVG